MPASVSPSASHCSGEGTSPNTQATRHAASGSMAVKTPAWFAGTRCKPVIQSQTVTTLAASA